MFAMSNLCAASAPGVAKTFSTQCRSVGALTPPNSTWSPGAAALIASWAAASMRAYCSGLPRNDSRLSGSLRISQWETPLPA
jgi:hypothetical protein